MKTARIRLNIDTQRGLAGPVLAALLTLLLAHTAQALGPPAGTTVSNQARLNYEIAGAPQQALSNTNAVTVQELINVAAVWQDAANITTASPALEQVLTYRVRNTGNGLESYSLGDNNSQPVSVVFAPSNPRIHLAGTGTNR